MNLRPASVSDVESLFDIRCSVIENHQSRDELATLGITTETVKEMIASGDYVTVIAEVDQQPVGFTMAQISESYIFACFVRPDFEKQGIGRALMKAVEEGLRAAGVTQVWLSTGSAQSLRAIGFYRHLGWTDRGHLEDGQIKFIKQLQDSE